MVQAKKMLGVTAEELYEMRGRGDEAGYERVFKQLLFKTFTCRVSLFSPPLSPPSSSLPAMSTLLLLNLTNSLSSNWLVGYPLVGWLVGCYLPSM